MDVCAVLECLFVATPAVVLCMFKLMVVTASYCYSTSQPLGLQIERKQGGSNTSSIVLPAGAASVNFTQWWASGDAEFVLLASSVSPLYRHSFTAQYTMWNSATQTATPLLPGNPTLNAAVLAPQGSKVAYVQNNDLFIVDSGTAGSEPVQVTHTGSETMVNGVPDWGYEEEVLTTATALWWAPDASHVAFFQTNTTPVHETSFDLYPGTPYIDTYQYRYPKPGYGLSVVTVAVYDVEADKVTWLDLQTGSEEYYVYQVTWKDATSVYVRWMNRLQVWGLFCS